MSVYNNNHNDNNRFDRMSKMLLVTCLNMFDYQVLLL